MWEVAEKENERGIIQRGKSGPCPELHLLSTVLQLMPLLRSAQTLPLPNPWDQQLQVNWTCTQLLRCIWPRLVIEGKKLHMWIKRNTRENPTMLTSANIGCSVPLPSSEAQVDQSTGSSWVDQPAVPETSPQDGRMSSGPLLLAQTTEHKFPLKLYLLVQCQLPNAKWKWHEKGWHQLLQGKGWGVKIFLLDTVHGSSHPSPA